MGFVRAKAAVLLAALLAAPLLAPVPAAAQAVDLELVLAIDISRSVDFEEGLLQREGYIAAFSNPLLLAAIQEGYYGRIAVTYFEWASWGDVRLVAPWMVIGDAPSAAAFTDVLRRQSIWTGQRTSISQAIDFGVSLFAHNGIDGDRKVIDISGDGHNNHGRHINDARQDAVAAGVTINGLPILNTRPGPGTPPLPDLDVYYKECVIGGPGAFVVVAEGFEKFAEAITRKLILEIANLAPAGGEERVAPGARHATNNGQPKVQHAQFLQPARPGAAAPSGPLRYGPYCEGPPTGGGGQLPPMLPLR